MVSILILTYNEEKNLPSCLESVKWSDDIVVFDSFSTDRTVEIARDFGVRVVQRTFDNWADHQNWAHEHIAFKHKWVYYSDADEIITPELRKELLKIASEEGRPEVAFRLRFKNMFMGRWIKHASLYPTWVLRFFQPSKIRWEREVNSVPVVDGQVGPLVSHFEHRSFNNGLSAWFNKHNRYSDGEAREAMKILRGGAGGCVPAGASGGAWKRRVLRAFRLAWVGMMAFRDPARRRLALKSLAWHLPCRTLLVFVYFYIVRMGFLDGMPGLRYCIMRAMYEYMIDLKIIELKRSEKGLPI